MQSVIEALLFAAVLIGLPVSMLLTDRASGPQIFDRQNAVRRILWLLAVVAFIISAKQSEWLPFLILPYLCFTFVIAGQGFFRLVGRGPTPFSELAIDLGRVNLAVAGMWWTAHAWHMHPLGIREPIVILTSIHFHFAGYFLPVLMGLSGRLLEYDCGAAMRRIYRIGILLLLTGIWLTATGILLGGTIEITLAIMFIMIVVGMILITGIGIWRVSFGSFDRSRERFRNRTARLLWTGALLCLTIGMWYALRFALRGSWLPVISIPGMVATHGMWNAIGFTGLALLAMFIMRPWLRLKFDPIPFSRLRGGLRIGTDFFTRHKLETATDKQGRALSGDHIGQSVRGLMDRFDSFQSAELNVKSVPVSIRDFYENTRDYNLIVSAQWQLGFKRAGRLYARWISRRIEQMNFPTQEQTTQNSGQEASRLLSRIFPINSERDGRNRVRAWVRGYVRPDGSVERAIYAAAYSEHSGSNRTYMNIAFPVPGGNLTSILRLEWRPQRNELLLTSREHQKNPGDQGVYLVLPLLTIRLPLNESIYVWVESKSKKGRAGFVASESTNANANAKVEADALLRARHDMWLFGIPFLQLHYEMRSERLTPA